MKRSLLLFIAVCFASLLISCIGAQATSCEQHPNRHFNQRSYGPVKVVGIFSNEYRRLVPVRIVLRITVSDKARRYYSRGVIKNRKNTLKNSFKDSARKNKWHDHRVIWADEYREFVVNLYIDGNLQPKAHLSFGGGGKYIYHEQNINDVKYFDIVFEKIRIRLGRLNLEPVKKEYYRHQNRMKFHRDKEWWVN